jgi:hypothetical protein
MTETKELMDLKKHVKEMSHGASITLRLCETAGITGSRRTVYGDSFFSSIDTSLQLSAHGLYFSGIVKTSHAGYPKMFLKDWFTHGFEIARSEETARIDYVQALEALKISLADKSITAAVRKASMAILKKSMLDRRKILNPRNNKKLPRCAQLPRGSHISLTATFKNKPLLCCAWADKTLKTSVGTCGHTLPGTPIKRTTYKALPQVVGSPLQDVRHRTFPIPIVFEKLFEKLPKIDIHDHLRQGTLALEKSWATHSWTKRVFSTILGVRIMPCIFLFSFFC